MAKHTPGPWFVGAQNDALYIIDRRPNATGNDYPNHNANVACIAKVYEDVRELEGSGDANARLIAAAPDLVAMLAEIAVSDPALRSRDWLLRAQTLLASVQS